MKQTKHIHEVLFIIKEKDGNLAPEDLLEDITNNWGADVQFGSCSDSTFPKEQALEFLLQREKVEINAEGKICIVPTMHMCDGHKNFEG